MTPHSNKVQNKLKLSAQQDLYSGPTLVTCVAIIMEKNF